MMTAEQRRLCRDLVICPNGLRRISKEDFVRKFPSAVEHGKLAVTLLEEARETQNSEDLECAFTVGFALGFAAEHASILCSLLQADWHASHEDVVSALDRLQTSDAVEALFRATQWTPNSLEYDDSRALAVKAIWALGKIPGNEAEEKLEAISRADNAILGRTAAEQLERRHKAA